LSIDNHVLHQILVTTFANLKVRYRQSWFGFIWVICYPLFIFGVQGFAFHLVLKIQLANYLQFLASGLIPWIFISQATEMSANLIVQSAPLINAYAVHPLIPVAAQVCDNFLNFIISIIIVLGIVGHFNGFTILGLLAILAASLPLFLGVLALGFGVAVGQVYFRDLKFFVTFVFQILFYLSPIFYPRDLIPENVRTLFDFNPIMLWIEPMRAAVLKGEFAWRSLANSLLFSLTLVFVVSLIWKRKRSGIGLYLN
jgi:lipopolysaccharide transport system permease protein